MIIRRLLASLTLAVVVAVLVPDAEAACIIKHVFVSAKPDGADATVVRPSNWNDCHVYSGGSNGQFVVVDTSDATYRTGFTTGLTYLSNQLLLPDGTVTAPALARNTTPALGLWFPNADTVAFSRLLELGAYTKAGLPTAARAGRLTRVTDTTRGLWMDQGSQWFSLSGEVVNVKEFGAKADGVTDDTAAIQAAIDAAPNGGVVLIPASTSAYIVTSALSITKPIAFIGAGRGSIIRNTGTGHLLHLNGSGTPSNITGWYIGHLTLSGAPGSQDVVRMKRAWRGQLENVHIPSAAESGLRLEGALLNVFSGLVVSGNIDNPIGTRAVPKFGVYIDQDSTGPISSNANVWNGLMVEAVTTAPGVGVEIVKGIENVFVAGTSEGNTIGVRVNGTTLADVGYNGTIAFHMEANGTDVVDTAGLWGLHHQAGQYRLMAGVSVTSGVRAIGSNATDNVIVELPIGGDFYVRENGTAIFRVDPGGSRVVLHDTASRNGVEINNVTTGNTPTIAATGVDANISINLGPKGTGGIRLNAGTPITKHLSATASIDFAAWAGQDCQTLTVTVTGAVDADTVSLGIPNALASVAGVLWSGFVSAADTVSVRGCKVTTGASADPAAATVRADVWQH